MEDTSSLVSRVMVFVEIGSVGVRFVPGDEMLRIVLVMLKVFMRLMWVSGSQIWWVLVNERIEGGRRCTGIAGMPSGFWKPWLMRCCLYFGGMAWQWTSILSGSVVSIFGGC